MAGPRPTESTRRALWRSLEQGGQPPEEQLASLAKLAEPEGLSVAAALLRELTHIWLPEHEAERLLIDILEHRSSLTVKLERDPGFTVAALDFLTTQQKMLREPVLMEREDFDRLEQSATTDALTGLNNRRVFKLEMVREIRRASRYHTPLSLIIFDLDHFKSINDQYGHMAGDVVLQEVARHIKETIRETDIACRLGGEEFAVLAPETTKPAAFHLADRIRTMIETETRQQPVAGLWIHVTTSAGIATMPEDGRDAATLQEHADASLYRAKDLGRNQVALHARERRRSVRYPVKAPNGVSIIDGFGERKTGRGLDLSAEGALLVAPAQWQSNETVTVHFPARSHSAPDLQCRGRIVRKDMNWGSQELCRYGVAFDEPLPSFQLFARVHFGGNGRSGFRS